MSLAGYLGVDVGSISINLLVINDAGEVLFDTYIRGRGDPIGSVQKGLDQLQEKLSPGFEIKGVCVTGSGRTLIGSVIGADVIKNEIMAHARASIHLHPDVQTILEIGGQDSKVTIVRDGVVTDFAMNLVCAAGTGSFLDSQAKRLQIDIADLSDKAVLSKNPTNIAGRCTVFAESDMIHKQQIGHKQEDILMGLCQAMVRNYISNVCRGKDIRSPVVLQGGVSENKGIHRAFEELLGKKVLIPAYNKVMGAYGAALIASQSAIKKTKFRGFGISQHNIVTTAFNCEDCSNCCEIIEINDNNNSLGKSGGRCGKWE